MPRPYPREFREDVIRVARGREPGTTLKQIAADFGISESCLTNWLAKADREDGIRPGPTSAELEDNRALRRQVRLLRSGQRGAAPGGGVSVAGEPAGKMMYPLVRELAEDGIPVTVTCRVLGIARQPYYGWRAIPVSDADRQQAHLVNAIFDAHRDDP